MGLRPTNGHESPRPVIPKRSEESASSVLLAKQIPRRYARRKVLFAAEDGNINLVSQRSLKIHQRVPEIGTRSSLQWLFVRKNVNYEAILCFTKRPTPRRPPASNRKVPGSGTTCAEKVTSGDAVSSTKVP